MFVERGSGRVTLDVRESNSRAEAPDDPRD
jgi:hypothetical protein